METKEEAAMMQYIYEAKIVLESRSIGTIKHIWQKSAVENLDINNRNKVEMYVLMDGTSRGVIVANYTVGKVSVFDNRMNLIASFYIGNSSFMK